MSAWYQKIMTVDEVAEVLRLKPNTVRDLLKRGELPGRKVGRVWRIDGARLKEFLSEQDGVDDD